ncbi:hypothetical protein JDS99_30165 [Bacillus cereus group sp. N6]|uniref:hypothetical protein n=1 Tax=Bacillus cereus group sp. N6 TaxID=2794583 RepID=UPI0018F6EF97|nr:hypothetical protein [Bacillus cereus group sp. N6]MBJ8113780.1 hypothetical protein [Bacillus cereus group sp. N6]
MNNRNIADLFAESASRAQGTFESKDNININDMITKQNDNEIELLNSQDGSGENDDILDFLKLDPDKKVVGFHLDKDIRQVFKKVLGKNPPRGSQSELANRIFRNFFEKRGLL